MTASETIEISRNVVEQLIDRVDELEAKLAAHKDHTGREFAKDRARITDVESQLEAEPEPEPDVDSSQDQETQTPLERIVSLPEPLAARELTANQERARFIARDVHDYAEKAPAGLVINSRSIKKVLAAKEGKRPHTQTVARVMDFLDDLGKGDVEQIKRRGAKLIVIDPDAADRYANHDRCDGANGANPSSGVIQPG